jgi:3-oxoadipate enol-lactonase
MDRLFANGTVNAAQSGQGPALFLFHSLLSDRASFDAIVPKLSQSYRVFVPELPGFSWMRSGISCRPLLRRPEIRPADDF